MVNFDTRTISSPVYDALKKLREATTELTKLKEQKNQSIELYTYLATWGLMRLKAEEKALSQQGKIDVVKKYFQCLEDISSQQNLAGNNGLETIKNLSADSYLGLTGLGLQIAQEFAFWANAIYHDVTGDN
ncbi:MAG: hypothetical protein GW795_09015 [Cyanobacteria bacterium]|nr:hypothetical protein [Cyanobacteria bacterium CG_2015-16_32_12]NCO78141.1 hypothetical protein [Cyanobacteria bacterium CG_2015-22_32_23]NCQ04097.1 hypothetical protein [Cyanobacteria bacterium CG_2015-09_32_10]NCQ42011.1 hypothetical protein [Cyanobacteria bacterium CG_2015-04_32_10]NCS83902.1 hypothetical protein [Cyanobacteria bacterium CG_2015-02_32_10]